MEHLTIEQACNLYQRFRDGSDGTVHPVRKYFGLPECDYCVRMAHKLWSAIMQIHSHQKGNGHLNNAKFPALAKMELERLNKFIDTINTFDISGIHKELKKLDLVFDNTH